jgi:hypothetical protein
MTVESDHVYYAGGVSALVHNVGGIPCGPLNNVNKAVNNDIVHAAEQAVARGLYQDEDEAAAAIRELSRQITRGGWPAGSIPDPAHPLDSAAVPLGSGYIIYEISPNGTAHVRTAITAAQAHGGP